VSASRVHDAITALVAALGGTASVTALVTVYDGPVITGDTPETAVFVGYDADPGGPMAAVANWTQAWAALGAQRKDEQFDVLCAIVSWSGDVDVPTRRAAAVAALQVVGDTLRAAVNIGLGLPQPTIAAFTVGGLFQEQGPNGLQVRIPFTVTVKTRV
jgi:hypothetical protein